MTNYHSANPCKILGAGGLSLALFLGLAACAPGPEVIEPETANVDIEDIAEEPETILGQQVTLRGEFVAEVDEYVFKLKEDAIIPDDTVLVINVTDTDYSVPPEEATAMWITGVVETFNRTTLAEQYDLPLEADVYEEFEGKPVVLADYIALAPDPEEIAENPDVFYNQRVVVDGDVETIFAPDAFSLENGQLLDEAGLLVVGSVPEITQEGPVSVSGILQPFSINALEAEYDLLWEEDIQTILEEEYTGQPVIVAQDIYPFVD
ncbi:MAG: hypothetical protein AAF959_00550 [Cyanobacteria bacterium P01_D01_bin.56]